MNARRIVLALCMVVVSVAMSAQKSFDVNLWEGKMPGKSGDATDVPVLKVFLPAAKKATGRAVVICPGGGYEHLCMDYEGTEWAPFLNDMGIAAIVLKYRMPHGNPSVPVSDAEEAIRLVRRNAHTWHINATDVGIMGFSAGGHLASSVSTHAEYDARPNFSILFYPVISMDERITHKGSCVNFLGEERKTNAGLVREWSNDKAVRRHLTPRAIILMSSDDEVVPPVTNGVAYYSAMRNEGNECTMHVYPTCGHGWGFRDAAHGFPYHEQMLTDLTCWLNSFKAPKEDAIRVACIGNSITDGFGIGMAPAKGYPAQLQKKLGDKYEVKNFGVSARTMMNKGDLPYMNELAWRDAQAFNPDIVIVKLGTNDSKTHNWAHGADEYRQSMQAMIDTLKALPSKPKIYLCSPIPAFKDSWTISDSIIVNGEMPIIKKLAKKNKCQFIDLDTSYTYGDMMLKDGIHPNAKGAEKMANIIFEAIEKK